MKVEAIGGPNDGLVIDTDRICNGSGIYCPVHGHGFYHSDEPCELFTVGSEIVYRRSADNPEKMYFAGVKESKA